MGKILAGLFTLLFALLTVVGVTGTYKLFAPRSVPVPTVSVAGTPDQIARGEYLAGVLCASCHSSIKQQQEKSGSFRGCTTDGYPLDDSHWWRK